MATVTVTARIPIADLDDMRRNLEWARDLLPETALEELHKEQARGNLRDETTLVDGKKNPNVFAVKPFGTIRFVEGVGPVDEAVAMAAAVIQSAMPRDSGHYQAAMRWFANGRPTGGPARAEQIGLRGNIEVVDLAPYAAMVEIQVPRGVIHGAFLQVSRAFGSRVSVGFRYADAADFGGHIYPPERRDLAGRFFKVPVLSIGNPTSTVRPGVMRSRPGASLAKRRRAVRRYLKGTGLLP